MFFPHFFALVSTAYFDWYHSRAHGRPHHTRIYQGWGGSDDDSSAAKKKPIAKAAAAPRRQAASDDDEDEDEAEDMVPAPKAAPAAAPAGDFRSTLAAQLGGALGAKKAAPKPAAEDDGASVASGHDWNWSFVSVFRDSFCIQLWTRNSSRSTMNSSTYSTIRSTY